MRKILLFFTFVSLSSFANAETTVMGLVDSTQRLQQQNNQLSTDVGLAKKDYEAAEKAREAAEKEYDVAYTDWKKTSGGIFGLFQGSGDPSFKSKLDAAKAKLDAAQKTTETISSRMEALETSARELSSKAAREEKDLKAAQKALAAALTAEHLVSDFARIEAKVGNTEQALNVLQVKYDNTTMAAYMRAKMGAMLNSDVMCQAQKNCADGATKVPVTDKQLKDAVFSTKGSGSSTPANNGGGVN